MKTTIISFLISIFAILFVSQKANAQRCFDPDCNGNHPVLAVEYIDLQNNNSNVPYSFTIGVPGEVIGLLPELLSSWTDNGNGTITITLNKRFFIDASPSEYYCMNIAVNTNSGILYYCIDLFISNNPY
ncbi:MAG: hypothetical protein ACI4BH_02600 [Muribaculaceae bacterium]